MPFGSTSIVYTRVFSLSGKTPSDEGWLQCLLYLSSLPGLYHECSCVRPLFVGSGIIGCVVQYTLWHFGPFLFSKAGTWIEVECKGPEKGACPMAWEAVVMPSLLHASIIGVHEEKWETPLRQPGYVSKVGQVNVEMEGHLDTNQTITTDVRHIIWISGLEEVYFRPLLNASSRSAYHLPWSNIMLCRGGMKAGPQHYSNQWCPVSWLEICTTIWLIISICTVCLYICSL